MNNKGTSRKENLIENLIENTETHGFKNEAHNIHVKMTSSDLVREYFLFVNCFKCLIFFTDQLKGGIRVTI